VCEREREYRVIISNDGTINLSAVSSQAGGAVAVFSPYTLVYQWYTGMVQSIICDLLAVSSAQLLLYNIFLMCIYHSLIRFQLNGSSF